MKKERGKKQPIFIDNLATLREYQLRMHYSLREVDKKVRKDLGIKNKRTLIVKDNGEYFYGDKKIIFQNPEALYAKVFRAIIATQDSSGIALYKDINRYIEEEGESKITDKTLISKRIRNAILNGMCRYLDLPDNAPNGEPLFKIVKGKGILLNNPIIEI